MKKAIFLSSFLAAAVFALPVHAQKAKDELVIGISQFPANFHPNIEAMMAKTYVLDMTRRPFTAYDKDWKLVCMLCTEIPTIENGLAAAERTPQGKKGIAVTYTIRPDAKWGDGKPVTTKDVMFTWKVGRHPKSGVGNTEFYRSLYQVDAKDDRTFTLHFDKLTFEYNAINDFRLIPAHLDEINFSDPVAYKNRTAFDTNTTNEGLYFGPYLISQVQPGSHIVLERNPTWWGAKPHFKRITVRAIENTAALEANLLSGEIDMIAGELGITIDQALAFEKRHGKKFNILYKPGLVYEHIDLNLGNPILKDKRVRQALLYALDREAINNKLFEGKQGVAQSNVNPLEWYYANDLSKYPHDPKRAVQLLAEAGWTKMRQGVRENEKGERLSFELMTTAGNRTRELIQQVLQSQWKQLGIDIRIQNQPARVFFGQTVTQRKFSGMVMYAWISSPENVPRTSLHSSHVPKAENNFAGQNYTGYANAEVDDLIEQIEVELNRDKRGLLWRRLQEIYLDELPSLPLFFRSDAFILPQWLKGVEPTGIQYPTTLWVENWKPQ